VVPGISRIVATPKWQKPFTQRHHHISKTRIETKGFVVSELVATAILDVGATRKIPWSCEIYLLLINVPLPIMISMNLTE